MEVKYANTLWKYVTESIYHEWTRDEKLITSVAYNSRLHGDVHLTSAHTNICNANYYIGMFYFSFDDKISAVGSLDIGKQM